MPFDPQVMASLGISAPFRPDVAPQLDPDVIAIAQQAEEAIAQRRRYISDKYMGGLTSPLLGIRSGASERAMKEITDPNERQWLIEDVAKMSKAISWAKEREYGKAGFVAPGLDAPAFIGGRFGRRAEQVGGAFADAGTAMVGAAADFRNWIQGRGRTEDVQFRRQLEAAKQGGDPSLGKNAPLSLRAAAGAAGMAPDLSAGLLAGTVGGPYAMFAYWTARLFPERNEDYLAMGLDPAFAATAGAVTAAAEAAIEMINIDPTGTTKGAIAQPVKGVVRRGISDAIRKYGGKRLISVMEKSPAVRVAISQALDALERTGIEITEEGIQRGVRDVGQYLAALTDEEIEGPVFSSIAPAMWQEMKDAAPGIAALSGGAGAGMAIGESAIRKQEVRQARIEKEILEYADQGKVPSRRKRVEWGLPEEGWESRAQRKEGVQRLAENLRMEAAIQEQARKIVEMPPGVAQEAIARVPEVAAAVMPSIEEAVPAAELFVIPEVMSEPGGAPLRSGEGVQAAMMPGEHGMAVEVVGTGEVIGGRKVVVGLEGIWDVPLKLGRVRGKAAGIYKRHEEIARLSRGQESAPAVAMHEIAHHIAKKYPMLMRSLSQEERRELGSLDYDQEKKRPSEGFAEFVRGYVTGSTHLEEGIDLKAVAPNFHESFQAAIESDPEMVEKLENSRLLIQSLRKAGAVGRVKGQIGQPDPTLGLLSTRGRIKRLFDIVYTKIKEEGLPIQRYVQAAKARGYTPGQGTTAFEDYNALRRTGEHFAASALEDGVFLLSETDKKVGPSLKEALAEIGSEEDYENFRAWAYARHAVESWSKGKDPGITLSDAQETQARLYDPRYERAADGLTAFGNGLILVLEDVGEISQEEGARMRDYYKTHIPLERVQEGKLTAGTRMRGLLGRKGLRKRKGSGLPVTDPVEALMARAIRTYDRAGRRIVCDKIVRTAETTEGLGEWVERVPPDMVPTQFKLDEIKSQLSPMLAREGIDVDEIFDSIDPMTALTIWRPEAMQIDGQPIFKRTVEGVTEYYQFRPDLFEALGGLETHHNLDIATHCARHFMGALKIGATRFNPSFILFTNLAKDYQTFLMQGERGLAGAVDPAGWACAWVYSEVMRVTGRGEGDPVVRSFKQMGGELSTYAGLDRHRLRQAARYAKKGRHGWATIGANITGTPEVASRLAEYAAVLEKLGWLERIRNGETPPTEVLFKCINAAHDVTVDFRRMGPWGRYLNYWIPFSNAKLEGMDKFIRTFKDHPARTLLRVGTQIVPFALMYWWLRHDDDDYKERQEWQDNFWTFTNSDGRPIIRIPKAHEWGLLFSGIERMLDAAYDKDPEAITRWFKQAWRTAVPDTYPVGVTTLFETMFNYDHFRKRAIVPEYLQGLEPVDQSFEYNTKLVKHAAKFMHDYSGGRVNLSPAKIEHLVNGLTGGMYSRAARPIEKAISDDPWAVHDVPGLKGITLRKEYTKSVGDLYDLRRKLSQQKKSADKHGEIFDPRKRSDLRKLEHAIGYLGKLRKYAKDQPNEIREQIERAMTGVARSALNRPSLERYPDPRLVEDALPELP